MKNSKKMKLFEARSLLTALFLCLSIMVFAQSKTVKGTVVDEKGEAIIGASVSVKGTTTGTMTDLDGNFSIIVNNNDVLTISYVGYTEQSVSVAGKTNVRVVLAEDSQILEEFVVVGYGVQKKTDVTGAMARVGEKELTAMPVKDAVQAMQGKAAGVDITSNQRPGQTGEIRIRGVRSIGADQGPLYVVDGMVLQSGASGTGSGNNSSGIDNLNPNDIESIDILKDASATAIYGSRGANGVVLVTTKRGKAGALSVNYSGTVTLEKLYNVSENMSAAEWLEYARIAKYNIGTYGSATPSYEADYALWGTLGLSWENIAKGWTNNNTVWDPSKVGSYDWEKHGKRTGVSTEHTLSVSGGNEKAQGYASFGYLKQEGTQPGQDFTRYSGKVSFDASPTKWFKMGASINLAWSNQDYGYNFTKSETGAGDYYSALRGMLAWTVPYDENGNNIKYPNGDMNIINPIDELKYTQNNRQTLNTFGNIYAQLDFGEMYSPLKGLKYRIQFGPEFKYYTTGTFNDEDGINGSGNNIASYNNYQTRAWTLDNLVYYDRNFGLDHKLGLTLMQSASKYHYEDATAKATDVATSEELWYNLGSGGSIGTFGSGLVERQLASYMIRANYGFRDKYLLTASVRWDGASQLADGNKWASFTSMALGWRIDQEKFMENVKAVSALKLRLGVGTTGNAAISAYATKGGLTQNYYNWGTTSSSSGYIPSDPTVKTPSKMPNPDLSWERTTQYNVGVDYGFLKNRINGSIDVYKSITNDLLLPMSIPSLVGYVSTYANVGKTEGWGIDLQINSTNIETKDFTWSTTLTWSKDRNKIKELANGRSEDIENNLFVGKEIGVYYDYVYDGIWKTSEAEEAAKYGRKPGQIRVKDLDGDGTIDANYDRKVVGSIRPDWSGGITNTFNYKNLELSFFIYSRWGFTVPNGALTLDGRYQMRKIDYWVAGTNENARYYSPGSNGEAADTYTSSMNYQDGSFIKMRNINIGYNFNQRQIKQLGIKNLKVYAQLMNPFTIYSKCDYLDTDLSNYDNNKTTVGSYTTTRALVFGLNIGF